MAGELTPLLQDLAIILVVAAAATILFNRLKQPVVLGYLLAGFVVGPFTPPFSLVSDEATIRQLGEIGVVFLLFALGLEFNLTKLRKVGVTALISGTLQVAIMVWLGYVVGRAFGLDALTSIFLGAIVSISSTVIIVKVVSERREQDAEWAQIVFGILIVEDILAVLMLTGLGAVGAGGAGVGAMELAALMGTFAFFIILALVVGILVVPRLLRFVARSGVDEMLVVTALALGVGLAVLGAYLGFSPALGAFVAGALIGESAVHKTVEERVAPVRDLFAAIFFVTVGMLVDPIAILDNAVLIGAVTVCIVVGKILAGSFSTFLAGRDVTTSLRVGFGLAQVGEFSFILAALAASLGVAGAPLYVVAVSAAAITSFTTPLLMRSAPGAARAFERFAPRPLQTYAALYGGWTRRLRELGPSDPARKGLAREALITALYAGATIAVLVLGGASVDRIATALSTTVLAVAWLAVGIAALPLAFLYVRAQRGFARRVAEVSVPPGERQAGVRRVVERTFFLGGLVLASAIFLLFASPFIPAGIVLPLVVLGVALAAIVLYRALARVHEQMDGALRAMIEGAHEGERRAILDLVREHYPWAASVREVELPETWAPITLRRLHVRGRTGASVVAIERAGQAMLNPSADAPLLARDRIVLLGGEPEIQAAIALVSGGGIDESRAPSVPASSHEIRIGEGAPFVGLTLGALQLTGRFGVTVLAIRRAGGKIATPVSSTRIEVGDVLLVSGGPANVERLEGHVASGRGA